MKKVLYLFIIFALASFSASAQDTAASTNPDNAKITDTTAKGFPYYLIGVRGGINLSDMRYTHIPYDCYNHSRQLQGLGGLFGHIMFNEHFSARPEITFIGRADSLDWLDVSYRLKAHYMDIRLPFMYNFRIPECRFSPYVMVAPELCMPYGGRISYHAYDFPKGVSTDITKADIRGADFGLLLGAGFDYLISTKTIPVTLSFELGYNMGFVNNFSQMEMDDVSIIKNMFMGAQMNQGSRFSNGIELAMRVAIPLGSYWDPYKRELVDQVIDTTPNTPDTVYVKADTVFLEPEGTMYANANKQQPNTIVIRDGVTYTVKDCYSAADMYSFVTLGIDISDKRVCIHVNFDFNSSQIRSNDQDQLDDLLKMMRSYPEMTVEIAGHTDSIGSEEYNQALSERRAEAVAQYLVKKGIARERMTTLGYGKMAPTASNETEEGRFENRRVEFDIKHIGERRK